MYQFVCFFFKDGGVCRNDFLMQLVSDLTLATVERPVSVESAVRGAAMMAGIEAGKSSFIIVFCIIWY